VVVCGNNKKVKADLEAKAASHHWGKGVDVVVKGFIGNMEDYMSAADCIVTKVSKTRGCAFDARKRVLN